MPDDHAVNLGNCVNVTKGKFFGIQNHNCHIFMECLLPVALRELPDHVWRSLTELSDYFRDLCSSILTVDDLLVMEKNISIIPCKLERIFPLRFFDSMEHLPVHLAFKAWIYMWTSPIKVDVPV